MGSPNSIQYDVKKFTLATGQSDYSVKTNIAELFDNIKVARSVIIKSDVTLTFKFNNSNLPAIEMVVDLTSNPRKNESPYQSPKGFLDVVDIFITNGSGLTANIEIMLV